MVFLPYRNIVKIMHSIESLLQFALYSRLIDIYLTTKMGTLRAALHLEAGPIRCVRGLKSSLVIGQKAQIGPNPFTPRG
jgi:hypothetical protein